jgi:hypothetical protein
MMMMMIIIIIIIIMKSASPEAPGPCPPAPRHAPVVADGTHARTP